MREIKFRAWNSCLGKMFYGSGVPLGYSNEAIVSESYDDIGESFEMPLMQYTGLKDKNGVSVYEGDIVKKSNSKFTSIGAVKFFHGCWMVMASDDKYFNLHFHLNECVIVGNIHENPELLDS